MKVNKISSTNISKVVSLICIRCEIDKEKPKANFPKGQKTISNHENAN